MTYMAIEEPGGGLRAGMLGAPGIALDRSLLEAPRNLRVTSPGCRPFFD